MWDRGAPGPRAPPARIAAVRYGYAPRPRPAYDLRYVFLRLRFNNRTVTGAGGRGRSHVTCTMHGCGHVRRGNLCVEDATPCSPALVASRSGEDS